MDQESLFVLQGYLASIVASFLWGLSPLLIDRIKWSSYTITLIRNLSTLSIVSLIMIIMGKTVVVKLEILILLMILGLTGPGLADQLFVESIKLIGVNMATILSYTYVFWASYMAHIAALERISIYDIAGSIITFTGLVIGLSNRLNTNVDKKYLIGVIYSLVSGFFWGIATIISRIMVLNLDPLVIVFFRSISALLLMILLITLRHCFYLNLNRQVFSIYHVLITRDFLLVSTSGLLSFLVAYVSFLTGLAFLGVVIPSIITLFSPIITLILSKYVKKYTISREVLISIVIILIGLFIASVKYF